MKATLEQLLVSYARTGSVWETAKEFGMCGQSVHERLQKAGFKDFKNRPITPAEESAIRQAYARPDFYEAELLGALAKSLGRTKALICKHAERWGLTNICHKKSLDQTAKNRARLKDQWKHTPHPRGMLGKKHTDLSRAKMSEMSQARAEAATQDEAFRRGQKMLKTKMAKYGTLAPPRSGTTWKAAWREIGGVRKYFRSRWEANYGHYLEWLKTRGEVTSWLHEPETFWFEGIRRGTTNYLPDFKVTFPDGRIEFHEVKGWMDDRSKTKIRRMAKYHPKVVLVVRGAAWFKANKALALVVPGWEK